MKNVYIVTHAESIHHVEDLGGGWYDTSLTANGITQANNIAKALYNLIKIPEIPVYSSDLKRAAETADIISRIFNSKVIYDRRLREMSYGEAEGKPRKWREQNIIPKPIDGDRLNHRIFNNSESRRDIGIRIQDCFNQIISKPDENIIIITHGFALTFIIMTWLKVPVENMNYSNFQTAPGRVTHLYEDDAFESRNIVYISKAMT
ncbi:histidine phosphatase family protein [Chloroflexota bacterium]